MLRAIIQFIVTAFALWLASYLIAGVSFASTGALLAAAFLLGLVNAVVRPILVFITFPLTVVTFGLFLLVVNAATIGLVASWLGGFTITGFWPGIGAAIVTGLVSWVAGTTVKDEPRALEGPPGRS
jgi:putative membrane protein